MWPCPHDDCWHSWKNATQMPAIIAGTLWKNATQMPAMIVLTGARDAVAGRAGGDGLYVAPRGAGCGPNKCQLLTASERPFSESRGTLLGEQRDVASRTDAVRGGHAAQGVDEAPRAAGLAGDAPDLVLVPPCS